MRCFVAVELTETVRKRLAALQQRFGDLGRSVRWVRPDAMHLTVKFLGEVPDWQLPDASRAVADVARQCRPFEFAIRSTGCFPPRGNVRVIWVGVEETSGELAACKRLCEDAFSALGFPKESRPFSPHLTLGRVKDPRSAGDLRERIAACSDFEAGTVSAGELVLFESRLSPQGAQYAVVHRGAFANP